MEKAQLEKKGSLWTPLHKAVLSLVQAPPKKYLLGLVGISLFLTLSYEMKRNHGSHRAQAQDPTSYDSPVQIDTFIPEGYVLFPVEILNFYSLDSIIGNFAVIDLYPQNHHSPIARGVRMIRSPADPTHVAVLVPEDRSGLIAKYGAQFYAVVQSPETSRTEFIEPRSRSQSNPQRRIIIQGEGP